MLKTDSDPQPPTSVEEHLTEALDQSEADAARYHLREALQIIYGDLENK
jgi:hypothetical protein